MGNCNFELTLTPGDRGVNSLLTRIALASPNGGISNVVGNQYCPDRRLSPDVQRNSHPGTCRYYLKARGQSIPPGAAGVWRESLAAAGCAFSSIGAGAQASMRYRSRLPLLL